MELPFRDDAGTGRGDPHDGLLATRLAGSSDFYQPVASAVSQHQFHHPHDGFPLNDLSATITSTMRPTCEGNRDGDNNNPSYNYGVEGPTRRWDRGDSYSPNQEYASTMLSLGVPMLLMGDECCRTQRGNNNAYCQDTAISWFN